jgi:predicted Rossmann fold nucleotide-binding protein DprA/Smf involved in DNA uptake
MGVSDQAQAVLLLTSHLAKSDRGEPRPLSAREWSRLAFWLRDHGLQPANLLSDDPRRLLSGWMDRSVTRDRIEYLLGRGGALGLALERWQRAGLWILARGDSEYPGCLKERLYLEAPPILFGCGNQRVLNKGGIAVVGSRNAEAEDLAFAAELGADAALQGLSIVSGGARGIDESATLGALERGGTAVVVLGDGLLRAATSAKYRKYLMSDDLVLVSPFNPEAGFNVGNLMSRNRYIYCLADAAIVVASGRDEGGTWAGAVENLEADWVPLWVKPHPDPQSGNAALARRGAKWLPTDKADLALAALGRRNQPKGAEELPLYYPVAVRGAHGLAESPSMASIAPPSTAAPLLVSMGHGYAIEEPPSSGALGGQPSSYEAFLRRMELLTTCAPRSRKELRQHLHLRGSQFDAWLRQAMEEGKVHKLKKPTVRYRWNVSPPMQATIFDDP